MANLINVGTSANDGTGDTLRDAFLKINSILSEHNITVGGATGEAGIVMNRENDTFENTIDFHTASIRTAFIRQIPGTEKLVIASEKDGADIEFEVGANSTLALKQGGVWSPIATEKTIREFRYTVDLDTAADTPTRAECITAFKKLPHFAWDKVDDFYIQSTNKDKVALIKYRPTPTSTDEASAGRFWVEVLTEAK